VTARSRPHWSRKVAAPTSRARSSFR